MSLFMFSQVPLDLGRLKYFNFSIFFVDAVLRKSVLALSEQFKNMSGDLICFAFQDNRKESFGF